MTSAIGERFGIEFPLFAVRHGRDVVAAVSRAGGFGVFGAVGYTPAAIHQELDWIDARAGASKRVADDILDRVEREAAAWAQNRVEARRFAASVGARKGPRAFAEKRAPVWRAR